MKTTLTKELVRAKKGNYAVPAFNYDNLEMLKGIIDGAEELNSPIILMVTESSMRYMGFDYALAIGKQAVLNSKVPVILHLDHAFDLATIKYAVDNGCDSVMIDASQKSFKENVALTLDVVSYAHKKQVDVESEIGHVGGKEDDRNSESKYYTNISEAIEFDDLTYVDALAVAVGTSHGVYQDKINLQFDLIKKLAEKIKKTQLVLHGASGVSADDLKQAINCGITKINFGTDLKIAYSDALRRYLQANKTSYDARKFGQVGVDAVKEIVREKILICQSNNKAKV